MILITGGAGYIGSHTVQTLIEQGKNFVIVDNFSNSDKQTLISLEKLNKIKIKFYEVDCCDIQLLERIFIENKITCAIHFAGFKAVGESNNIPLEYYINNLFSTLNLLNLLKKYNVKRIIFSSSATVYGNPATTPITEDFPLSVTNPYGRTKLIIEDVLRDLIKAEPDWSIGILRYFNPIGAHESALIGDKPNGIPNNIMPYISQVASKKRPYLPIFGNDYPTHDGTGVRDYIHVVDLAKGHVALLDKLANEKGLFTYNLGTGTGYSVLDLLQHFEQVSGEKIEYKIEARRKGDIAICYADSTKAYRELNWKATCDLKKMIEDTWRFEKQS